MTGLATGRGTIKYHVTKNQQPFCRAKRKLDLACFTCLSVFETGVWERETVNKEYLATHF